MDRGAYPFGWLRRDRHLAKDYERKVQTSETSIEEAMIGLMLQRLARAACPLQNNSSKTPDRSKSRHRTEVLASCRAVSARGRGLAARFSPP